MEKNSSTSPVWSLSAELLEIVDVDFGLIQELVSLFLADSMARQERLSRACAAEDFKAVRAEAHSLKGSALQMGATGLASLCSALELSQGHQQDQCEAMVKAIHGEFTLVRRAMEGYIATSTPAKGNL